MKRKFPVLALCGLAALAAGCASVAPAGTGGEASRAATFSYKWDDTNLAIVLDVELARRRTEEAYFPLGIKIANKRLNRIIVDRETLFLIDEYGDRLPDAVGRGAFAPVQQARRPTTSSRARPGVLGDEIMTGLRDYRKAAGRLFPQTQGGGRTVDSIYVQTNGYMEDLVYFPMPEGGIKGKTLRLRLDVYELGKPLDVAFRVD